MVHSHDLCSLDQTLAGARDRYIAAVEEAERLLEARRTGNSVMVQNSAKAVANLDSQLELFEALEHERMSAQVRRELATAIEQHQDCCRRATRLLREAFRDYAKRLLQAAETLAAEYSAE